MWIHIAVYDLSGGFSIWTNAMAGTNMFIQYSQPQHFDLAKEKTNILMLALGLASAQTCANVFYVCLDIARTHIPDYFTGCSYLANRNQKSQSEPELHF